MSNETLFESLKNYLAQFYLVDGSQPNSACSSMTCTPRSKLGSPRSPRSSLKSPGEPRSSLKSLGSPRSSLKSLGSQLGSQPEDEQTEFSFKSCVSNKLLSEGDIDSLSMDTISQYPMADISNYSDPGVDQSKYLICGMMSTTKSAVHNTSQLLSNGMSIYGVIHNEDDKNLIKQITNPKCNIELNKIVNTEFILNHRLNCSAEKLIKSGVSSDCVKYFQLFLSLFYYLWGINETVNSLGRSASKLTPDFDNNYAEHTTLLFFSLLFEKKIELNDVLSEPSSIPLFKQFLEYKGNREVKELMEKVLGLLKVIPKLIIYFIYYDVTDEEFKINLNGIDYGPISNDDCKKLLIYSTSQNFYPTISLNANVVPEFKKLAQFNQADSHCMTIQDVVDGDVCCRNTWKDFIPSPQFPFIAAAEYFKENISTDFRNCGIFELNGIIRPDYQLTDTLSEPIKTFIRQISDEYSREAYEVRKVTRIKLEKKDEARKVTIQNAEKAENKDSIMSKEDSIMSKEENTKKRKRTDPVNTSKKGKKGNGKKGGSKKKTKRRKRRTQRKRRKTRRN